MFLKQELDLALGLAHCIEGQPTDLRFLDSISVKGTYRGCRLSPQPWLGCMGEAIDVSLSQQCLFLSPLPSTLSKNQWKSTFRRGLTTTKKELDLIVHAALFT